MSILSKAVGIANSLLPDSQTERLTFRKYNGKKLATAVETGTELASKDVVTVTLKINPQEVAYQQAKIINKIATNAPGRFIIYDWGNDLTILSITGCTGNMLPEAVTNNFDPIKGFLDTAVQIGGASGAGQPQISGYKSVTNDISSVMNTLMKSGLGYFDILDMSPKYKTFKKLQKMYEDFDADMDVLVLEYGPFIYRGYLTEFRFSQLANEPWNWKYSTSFVVISELNRMDKKEDQAYTNDTNIIAR
jgi:hypothetical protein